MYFAVCRSYPQSLLQPNALFWTLKRFWKFLQLKRNEQTRFFSCLDESEEEAPPPKKAAKQAAKPAAKPPVKAQPAKESSDDEDDDDESEEEAPPPKKATPAKPAAKAAKAQPAKEESSEEDDDEDDDDGKTDPHIFLFLTGAIEIVNIVWWSTRDLILITYDVTFWTIWHTVILVFNALEFGHSYCEIYVSGIDSAF